MANIYELADNYNTVLDMLYDENIDEEMILDTLEGIEGEIEDKADNYAKIIRELEARRDARKNEAKRLLDSSKVFDNRITSLKKNLYNAMKITNKPKFATNLFSFSIVRNGGKQPLFIDGEVPEEYIKTIKENDNEKIRADLEAGKKLPFAHLESRGESLRIK